MRRIGLVASCALAALLTSCGSDEPRGSQIPDVASPTSCAQVASQNPTVVDVPNADASFLFCNDESLSPAGSSTAYVERVAPSGKTATAPPVPGADCTRLTRADYRSLGQGLNDKHNQVIDGYVEDAEVSNDYDVTWIYAVRVKVPGGSQDMLIASDHQSPAKDSGLLLGIGVAKDYFKWGDRIPDGSPVADARDEAATSTAATTVMECLAEG